MRVLISGAGVAGPTLAWFLARAGAQITIVEKSHTLLPHGQNIDIGQAAVEVVKKMGLLDEIRRYHTTEKGTQFVDSNGIPYAPFPCADGQGLSLTSQFEILRGDLAKVLYEATKQHPNVKYLFNTTVQNVVSNSNETVKVELSTGEMQDFDVLVAADGQWSKIRQQCFPADSVRVVDKDMFGAYWTTPRTKSDDDMWNIYIAPDSKILSIRPDPHGTSRAMITRMPCNVIQRKEWQSAVRSDRKTQIELLKKEFCNAGWQAERLLATVEQAPDLYFQAMQQIKMSKWSHGRIVCLGDAAYAPTPLTGMGASLAILGPYVLAGELSKLSGDEHPRKAFDAYEETFKPFVERIQHIPSFIPGIAHPETTAKRWLLQFCLRIFSKLVTISWITSRFDERDDENFPLPYYPSFESQSSDNDMAK